MKIKEKVLEGLNDMLSRKSFIEIVEKHSEVNDDIYNYFIQIKDNLYVDNKFHPILNLTEKFVEDVEWFLECNGVEKVIWNNNNNSFTIKL